MLVAFRAFGFSSAQSETINEAGCDLVVEIDRVVQYNILLA